MITISSSSSSSSSSEEEEVSKKSSSSSSSSRSSSSSTSEETTLLKRPSSYGLSNLKTMLGVEKNISLPSKYLATFPFIRKSFILAFSTLSRFTELLFFTVIFPRDIIDYIIRFYFLSISKTIEENIFIFNICLCENKDCIDKWYDPSTDSDIYDQDYYFKIDCNCQGFHTTSVRCDGDEDWFKNHRCIKSDWHKLHCTGEGCHTIFDQSDDSAWFICDRCKKEYCNDCWKETYVLNEDDSDDYDDYNEYCKSCSDIVENEYHKKNVIF